MAQYKVYVNFITLTELEVEADSEAEAEVVAKELIEETFPEVEEALDELNLPSECLKVEVENVEILSE
jgi:hypothetical protein